jgi:hypothetical protein
MKNDKKIEPKNLKLEVGKIKGQTREKQLRTNVQGGWAMT